MTEWIQCEDDLPEEGTWVLVWIPDGTQRPYIFFHVKETDIYLSFWTDETGRRFYDGDDITHWASLPEPPKEA